MKVKGNGRSIRNKELCLIPKALVVKITEFKGTIAEILS